MAITASQMSKKINLDYGALESACERHGTEAVTYLKYAFTAALENEKKHREYAKSMGISPDVIKAETRLSAPDVARYLVVQYYSDPKSKAYNGEKLSYLEAARTMPARFYAYAVRELLLGSYVDALFVTSQEYNVRTLELAKDGV